MKIKIGNLTTTLPKDVVASHMANLITTRLIILDKETDFKKAFIKYKDLVLSFFRENKKFVFSFSDEKWFDEFTHFQEKQHELMLQDVVFKFDDGSTWSIPLLDIANLKILQEPDKKYNRTTLLSSPLELVMWAQDILTWDQIENFAVLRNIDNPKNTYNNEWPSVAKKIIKWHYGIENKSSESQEF
jgi:hypothetical protein